MSVPGVAGTHYIRGRRGRKAKPEPKDLPPRRIELWADNIALLGAIAKTIIIAILICLLLVLTPWKSISHLFSSMSVTHVEALGVKVDIDNVRGQKLQALEHRDPAGNFLYEPRLVEGALARANRNLASVSAGKILWVSDELAGNRAERDLLQSLGIQIQVAASTTEAMALLKDNLVPVDLIVTDAAFRPDFKAVSKDGMQMKVWSGIDRKGPSLCPTWYYAPLYGKRPKDPDYLSANTLNINALRGRAMPSGFAMLEEIASDDLRRSAHYGVDRLFDRSAPRVIVYSLANGGIAMNACTRIVTNRVDRLIDTIVTILEEAYPFNDVGDERGGAATTPVTSAPASAAPAASTNFNLSPAIPRPERRIEEKANPSPHPRGEPCFLVPTGTSAPPIRPNSTEMSSLPDEARMRVREDYAGELYARYSAQLSQLNAIQDAINRGQKPCPTTR